MLSDQPDQIVEDQQQQQQQQGPQESKGIPKPQFSSKHPLGKFQKSGGQFRSPTDNLMSPATKKVEAKRNHLLSKIKPRSLAGDLSAAAEEEQASKQA
ncbi:hypothetical protein PhCBS80983_g01421 [Powellomyces hirtus]|uniref:Uncharacterized protein n=1 Tax=Powellomyces hirtus TaxID=109895 RepID=A0A507EC50_9FUNG|nr:hypothetical protein PhCBS80983_g01421 [Powellomyces hirtus]